ADSGTADEEASSELGAADPETAADAPVTAEPSFARETELGHAEAEPTPEQLATRAPARVEPLAAEAEPAPAEIAALEPEAVQAETLDEPISAEAVVAESEVLQPELPEPVVAATSPAPVEPAEEAIEVAEIRNESAAAGIAEVTPIAAASAPEPVDLKAVAASAGLQMVETSQDARRAEPEPIVVEPRKPRMRKAAAPIAAEPLQQVETRPGDEA